jgi:hypothetical protein
LKILSVENWSRSKKNELKARITSNEEDANWGILCEVQVAAYLIEKFGDGRVKHAPTLPNGKKCDASALVNRRVVFFEVTAVNVGLVEDVLKDIFDNAGSAIYQNMSADAHVRLDIDTSKLIKTDGDFDVEKCKEQLISSYQDLGVESFLTVNGNLVVDVSDVQGLWEKDRSLADQVGNLTRFDAELAKRIEHGELSTFSNLTPRAFENTPFTAIWKMDSRRSTKAVELVGQGVYPSAASLAEQSSFFKRLRAAVKRKTSGGQLRKGEPNILVIRASNWTVSGYERTGLFESDIAELEFDRIRPELERCLDELKSKSLSVIMLYENEFANAQVIFNKYAQGGAVLTSGELNLLISPQAVSLSPFMEFATETIDEAKITQCLEALVRTYNGQTIVRRICDVQPFAQEEHAHLKFIQVGYRTRVPKSWFIDPAMGGNEHIFAEYGSAISEGETRFALNQIEQNATKRNVSAFTLEEIVQAIIDFRSKGGNPSVILLPLELYVSAHSWRGEDGTPAIRYEGGKPKMVVALPSSNPLELPPYFLRKETEIGGVIIYDRGHGTMIYKKPSPSEFISAQLNPSTEDNTKLELLAKSVITYQVKNKALALVLTCSAVNP